MIYTDVNDPNLPDEVKALNEVERNLYLQINNPFFNHKRCQDADDPTALAHFNAMRVVAGWQSYHPIIRG